MTTSVQAANLFQLRGRHLHLTYEVEHLTGTASFVIS